MTAAPRTRPWGLIRPLAVAVALAALGLAAAAPTPAYAYVSQSNATAGELYQSQGLTHEAMLTLVMAPGDAHLLRAEVYADNNYSERVVVSNEINCFDPTGAAAGHIWGGTNLAVGASNVETVSRFMFMVPPTGLAGTYTCYLDVNVSDFDTPTDGQDGQLYVRGTSFIGDVYGRVGTNTALTTEVAQTILTSPAVVVSPGGGTAQYAKILNYSLPAWASHFNPSGDVYITNCYDGSQDCATHVGSGTGSAVATSQLEAIEYQSDGATACHTWLSQAKTTTVTYTTHHLKVQNDLSNVTHDPNCANLWKIDLLLSDAAGANPYVITWDGGPYTVTYTTPLV